MPDFKPRFSLLLCFMLLLNCQPEETQSTASQMAAVYPANLLISDHTFAQGGRTAVNFWLSENGTVLLSSFWADAQLMFSDGTPAQWMAFELTPDAVKIMGEETAWKIPGPGATCSSANRQTWCTLPFPHTTKTGYKLSLVKEPGAFGAYVTTITGDGSTTTQLIGRIAYNYQDSLLLWPSVHIEATAPCKSGASYETLPQMDGKNPISSSVLSEAVQFPNACATQKTDHKGTASGSFR